jgi:nucleotide-binding universal stress UspA family protein
MDRFVIVAGWDGSPESEAAVRCAGELASRCGAALRVVLAWDLLSQPAPFDPAFHGDDATRYVSRAARRLLPAGLPHTALAVLGLADDVLVDQSGMVDIVVIGRSGLGRVLAPLIGSTATAVVRHARCPVLVVPESKGAST